MSLPAAGRSSFGSEPSCFINAVNFPCAPSNCPLPVRARGGRTRHSSLPSRTVSAVQFRSGATPWGMFSHKERQKTQKKFASRSEEHTSELQSLTNLVCRLLLEKKKKKITN